MIQVKMSTSAQAVVATTVLPTTGSTGQQSTTGDQHDKSQSFAHLYSYSGSNKAGMEMVDKQRQSQIIYELSKNSAYFRRAAKLDADTDRKVESMRRMLAELSHGDGSLEARLRGEVEAKVVDLEHRRSFDRVCCVLDMDMFYAAVEIRDQPSLAEQPVAVGSLEMISTSNYVARKYGVRSAMPGFIAKKLCPQLVFVPCNFDKYRVVAEQIRSVIGEYDRSFSSYSLDEVYFDLTEAARDRISRGGHSAEEEASPDGAPEAQDNPPSPRPPPPPLLLHDISELRRVACVILEEIRSRISTITGGLTASAGIANNFFLAKICADFNKPNGQYELPPTRHAVMEFVSELPTRKVGGIGKVTERMLKTLLDISTMGQVRACLPQLLHCFTPQLGQFLLRTSYGVSSEEIAGVDAAAAGASGEVLSRRKSLGCERTYSSRGLTDRTEVLDRLKELCEQVSTDLQQEDLWAQGVTLKVKTVDFELLTRSITHKPSFFQSSAVIMQLVTTLVSPMLPFKTGVRLLGVQVTRFRWPDEEGRGRQSHTADGGQRKIDALFMSSTARRDSSDRRDTDDDRRRPVDDDDDDDDDEGGREIQQQPSESTDDFLRDETAEDLHNGADGSKGNDDDDDGRLRCPVCNVAQCDTLQQLNQHLDRCLADDGRYGSSHCSSSSGSSIGRSSGSGSSTVVSRGGTASIGRSAPHTIDSFLTTISSSQLIAMSTASTQPALSFEGVRVRATGRVQKRKHPIAISDYFMR